MHKNQYTRVDPEMNFDSDSLPGIQTIFQSVNLRQKNGEIRHHFFNTFSALHMHI